MSSNHSSPSRTEQKLRNIQSGIATVLTGGKQLLYGGNMKDANSLDAIVAALLAPYEAVHDDRQALSVSVANRRSNEAAAKQAIEDFKNACLNTFGESSSEYRSFGFEPRKKPAPLTAEKHTLKVARNAATRSARGTKGSRQKLAIKG